MRYEIGRKFYNINKSMYEEVNTCFKTGDSFSSTFKSGFRVKQWEVVSLILFNIYLNDLPEIY